jgi:hypothetical protein
MGEGKLPAREIAHAAGHGGRALAMAQAICIDVASLARTVLGRSKIFDIRALDVDQAADSVVLRGSVDSFYHKQLAQEMIKTSLEGVEVINEIRVDYSRDRTADDCDWQW